MLFNKNFAAWAFSALMLAGCGHAPSNEHGHDHAHETAAHAESEHEGEQAGHGHDHDHDHDHPGGHFAETAYNEDLELYAEIPALVAGHEVELTVYLTSLNDFKPVSGAKLDVALLAGSNSTKAKMAQEVAKGTYKVHIDAGNAAPAQLLAQVEANGKKSSLCISGLKVCANHHEAHEDMEAREADTPNAVAFPKLMSWNADFSTQPVQTLPMGQVIKTVAQIQPSQADEQMIVANADGVVAFGANTLVEGKQVAAGQTVCTIDGSSTVNNNLSAQQQQAATELQRAKNEYERLSKLSVDKLVLEADVQAAKATYEQAQQNYNALHKSGSGRNVAVTASRSGYVKQVMVANGQYVTAGTPVAVVSQARSLRLKANVRPRYFGQLRHITGANIRQIDHDADDRVWTLQQLHGRVLSYGRQADAEANMVPVFFEVDNIGNFLPGTYVEMLILTNSQQPKTVVPAESVLEEMGNYFVFVQVTPELFEKRQVRIGETDGLFTQVASGVHTGERVVAKGAMLVKMQQAAGAVDPHSGHSH